MSDETKTVYEALIPFAVVGAEIDDKTGFNFSFKGPDGSVYATINHDHFRDAFAAYASNSDFDGLPRRDNITPVIDGLDKFELRFWKNTCFVLVGVNILSVITIFASYWGK